METAVDPTPPPPPPPAPRPAPAPPSAECAQVCCPLCDYDLRGLTEPRCPECGYRFEWADLTDPDRKRHPYLFEHHPRRNVRSFVRTMLGGLRPRRFWTSLKPSQPSRPGRLIVYWLVSAALLPAMYAGQVGFTAVRFAKEHERNRSAQLTNIQLFYSRYAATAPQENTIRDIVARGGPQAWVDYYDPPTSSPRYLPYVHQRFFGLTFEQDLEATEILLVWPWATLAVLMVFRASMRRAKVNSVHVLRAALYSCDATLGMGLLALTVIPWLDHSLDLGRYIGFRDAAVSALLFAAVTTWRLAAAYRHYLQFARPLATAASAQVVVLLATWVYLYVLTPIGM